MLATGKLSADAIPGNHRAEESLLGLEFSGIYSKGKRVMGSLVMWEVPKGWTLEDAATVPVVYATAYYALLVRGEMKTGESVLIHSGSGGVGQAAIAIALGMKCRVFTTVGSRAKREFLKSQFPELGEDSFSNS
jgi:fatty acid synthase